MNISSSIQLGGHYNTGAGNCMSFFLGILQIYYINIAQLSIKKKGLQIYYINIAQLSIKKKGLFVPVYENYLQFICQHFLVENSQVQCCICVWYKLQVYTVFKYSPKLKANGFIFQ